MAFTCANLTAYWAQEESGSNPRIDAKGANDLTPTGVVGQDTGIIGQAASFSGTSYLSRPSTTDLTMSGNVPFSLALWFYLATTATQGLLWKGTNVTGLLDYEWRLNTSSTNVLFAVTDGPGAHQGVVTTTATWALTTWTFLAAWYDGAFLYCSLNNAAPTTTAYTFGSWAGSHALGCGASGNGSSIISNGSRLDEVSVWKNYAFTSDDVTTLYNAGAGYGYDSICPVGGDPFPAWSAPRHSVMAPILAQ